MTILSSDSIQFHYFFYICQLNPDFFSILILWYFNSFQTFVNLNVFIWYQLIQILVIFNTYILYVNLYQIFFYFNTCHFTLMWDVNLYQIFFYFNTCHFTLMWNVNLVQTFVNFIFSIGFYLYLTISPISVHILSFLCKNLA